MTTEQIAELRALAEVAYVEDRGEWYTVEDLAGPAGMYFEDQDAAFIAAANPATIIALCDEIGRLAHEFDWAKNKIRAVEAERDRLAAALRNLRQMLADGQGEEDALLIIDAAFTPPGGPQS
jgi:hypothetical protein